MPHEVISDVVVMHAHGPMRLLLRMVLQQDGYAVTEAPTYTAVLRHLHMTTSPTVVVAGNWTADYRAETEFFGQVAAEAELARRHRFVLLTTIPEYLPAPLDGRLRSLGVPVVRSPFFLPDLLAAVAAVAGRSPAEDASAG